MAKITIKNLIRNDELDRDAMSSIAGGARLRGRQAIPATAGIDRTRVVDYPPGFTHGYPPLKTTPGK